MWLPQQVKYLQINIVIKGVIMLDLNKEIKYVKGVGSARAELLNKIGIFNLKDLITYFPREYEDRSKPRLIQDIEDRRRSINRSNMCF